MASEFKFLTSEVDSRRNNSDVAPCTVRYCAKVVCLQGKDAFGRAAKYFSTAQDALKAQQGQKSVTTTAKSGVKCKYLSLHVLSCESES